MSERPGKVGIKMHRGPQHLGQSDKRNKQRQTCSLNPEMWGTLSRPTFNGKYPLAKRNIIYILRVYIYILCMHIYIYITCIYIYCVYIYIYYVCIYIYYVCIYIYMYVLRVYYILYYLYIYVYYVYIYIIYIVQICNVYLCTYIILQPNAYLWAFCLPIYSKLQWC